MKYEDLRGRVGRLKSQFTGQCELLGIDPNRAVAEIWKDIVIRAVHESNWQEGIAVERGRTREVAMHVFDDLDGIVGPHLDFSTILMRIERMLSDSSDTARHWTNWPLTI